MDPKAVTVIVVIVAVIIAALLISWGITRKRRRAALQQRFGPEYERAVRVHGARQGETVLEEREKRVEKFRIRELTADERERFVSDWRHVKSMFVDDPAGAVGNADSLVTRLMEVRGYPMSDFEQRAADISVNYPRVVDSYRAAHEIALRHRRGEATTEDLRNSMIYYRSLFEELLQPAQRSDKREVA